MKRNWIGVAAAMALAACSESGGDKNWLTMPTAEQHAAQFFPANAGSVHAPFTCNDCHTNQNTFREFDCLSCHTGAHSNQADLTTRHASVANFQFQSAACLMCHKNGLGIDHAPIFPITSGAHAGVACADCHVSPTDRKVLGCAGCHPHDSDAGAQHTSVIGYLSDSASCVRCHADSQVNRIASHTAFRISGGAHTGDPGARCLRCHTAFRTDKPFGADFKVFTCVDCHNRASIDRSHSGRSGYAYTTEACHRCHPSGRGED